MPADEPYTVPIGPHRVAVISNATVTKRLVREGKYGETDLDTLTIYIRQDIPPTLWNETLIHETCHAILGITGMSIRLGEQLEEDVVSALAPLLAQAYATLHTAQGAYS